MRSTKTTRELQVRFPIDIGYISAIDKSYIALALRGEHFYIGDPLYEGRYSYGDVLGIEVLANEVAISQTSRGSQAVGAAIGGLAFGGPGFIVGGLSGSARSTKRITSLHLKVRVEDRVRPTHSVCFLANPLGIGAEHPSAREAWDELDTFHSQLLAGLRRSEEALGHKLSLDDLYKALQLHQAGLLSDAEFNEIRAKSTRSAEIAREQPTNSDVILHGPCKKWFSAQQEVERLLGRRMSWTETKVLHERASMLLTEDVSSEEGERIQRRFLELGARIELRPRVGAAAILEDPQGTGALFDVILRGPCRRFLSVSREVEKLLGRPLKGEERKVINSDRSLLLKSGMLAADAAELQRRFLALGAEVQLRPHGSSTPH